MVNSKHILRLCEEIFSKANLNLTLKNVRMNVNYSIENNSFTFKGHKIDGAPKWKSLRLSDI